MRTGRLRNSVDSTIYGVTGAVIQPHVDYAGYVALGTEKMAPNPYHERARDMLQDIIDVLAQESIDEALALMGVFN